MGFADSSPYMRARGGAMQDVFREFNVFVYCSAVSAILDVVLWCLGPYVDDSHPYSTPRLVLAVATRKACRVWLRARREL